MLWVSKYKLFCVIICYHSLMLHVMSVALVTREEAIKKIVIYHNNLFITQV